MPRLATRGVGMRKSCVKRVSNRTTALGINRFDSTQEKTNHGSGAEKYPVYPNSLHTFCTQFSPRQNNHFTEIFTAFSTVSTALIIRTIPEREEKLLIGQRG